MTTIKHDLAIFFDGQCPVCSREAKWLTKIDRHQRLDLLDIRHHQTALDALGIGIAQANRRIHAVNSDGEVMEGLDVFIKAYQLCGLGYLWWPLRLKPLRWLADRFYDLFARTRYRVFGRKSCACHQRRPRQPLSPAG